MNRHQLENLGVPSHLVRYAHQGIGSSASKNHGLDSVKTIIRDIVASPASFVTDAHFGELATRLIAESNLPDAPPAPVRPAIWGTDIEPGALKQIDLACQLPVTRYAAVMPDAHQGYGVCIGGVVATDNAVIPNAVGVDIGCRMKLSILDPSSLETYDLADSNDVASVARKIVRETRFGTGANFSTPRQHAILDDPRWKSTKLLRGLHAKAVVQLGTSGGGNHFVDFGYITVNREVQGVKPGTYLALMTHSGSRGPGATIASEYKLRAEKLLNPKYAKFRELAWLSMDSEDGIEYWEAMNLAGDYASANHDCIHDAIIDSLAMRPLAVVENHHNFAWKETHFGQNLIVHRKGATPAGAGVLGIIPGSMNDPAFLVSGLGNANSLHSASHGAGRKMSRKQAKSLITQEGIDTIQNGIHLISAGHDEYPHAYKNIREVMACQEDLVEVLGEFTPKVVLMAGDGSDE